MSGTFPTTPGFSAFNVESDQPVVVTTSESGKSQARIMGGHLWRITAQLPPMTQAEFAPIDAFIMKQNGEYSSFDITSPFTNQGTWISESPQAYANYAAGVESITLKNLTAGKTVTAGDIFRPANHNKVYKIVTGGTADGSGNVAVMIKPALIEALTTGEAITCTNVMYHVSIKNKHQFKTSIPMIYRYELDLMERL